MDATYMGDKGIEAQIGDVVLGPGNIRAIVIGVKASFITILGIGTSTVTGVPRPRIFLDTELW
jgi:hypothetical protein